MDQDVLCPGNLTSGRERVRESVSKRQAAVVGESRAANLKCEENSMQVIKSVGVLSVAKIMGLIQACIGLIFIPFFLLIGLLGTMAGKQETPFAGMIGMVFAFCLPIIYGVMGFVVGAIGAALYNLFAKWIGGIE